MDLAYQCEKLLVPSPQHNTNNQGYVINRNQNISVFKAAYQSFSDAPGGAS